MFTVTIILVFVLLVLIFVVNFVLTNLAMFQTPFDIVISVPFFKWSHTWQGVEFMYIIAGSVFLGAIVIALSTWVLDTRRKLKLRGLRKELKRLKQELQDVKASFPEEIREEEEREEVAPPSETPENMDTSSATPEDVTRSFENVVQDGEFLRKKREDQDRLKIEPPDNNPDQKNHEAADVDAAQQLLEETPIEAELIDSENSVQQEKGSSPKEAEKH